MFRLYADRAGVHLLTTSNKMLCLWYTEEIENLSGVGHAFLLCLTYPCEIQVTSR